MMVTNARYYDYDYDNNTIVMFDAEDAELAEINEMVEFIINTVSESNDNTTNNKTSWISNECPKDTKKYPYTIDRCHSYVHGVKPQLTTLVNTEKAEQQNVNHIHHTQPVHQPKLANMNNMEHAQQIYTYSQPPLPLKPAPFPVYICQPVGYPFNQCKPAQPQPVPFQLEPVAESYNEPEIDDIDDSSSSLSEGGDSCDYDHFYDEQESVNSTPEPVTSAANTVPVDSSPVDIVKKAKCLVFGDIEIMIE